MFAVCVLSLRWQINYPTNTSVGGAERVCNYNCEGEKKKVCKENS